MGTLSLAICLGMMSSREQGASSHQLPQGSPQVTSKPGIPVMHQRLWHPIQAYNVIKQKLGYLPRTKKATTHSNRHQLHQLGEPINNGENGIVTTGLRQISNEVQGVGGKPAMWNWQRLQQTSRQLRGILNLLTDVAPRHKVSHRSPHPGPPHARKQGSTHLASSKMAPKRSTVLLLHEQLPQATPTGDDKLLCTICSNMHKQVNTMLGNNPEVRGLPTCTLNRREHVCISTIKRGSGHTLHK